LPTSVQWQRAVVVGVTQPGEGSQPNAAKFSSKVGKWVVGGAVGTTQPVRTPHNHNGPIHVIRQQRAALLFQRAYGRLNAWGECIRGNGGNETVTPLKPREVQSTVAGKYVTRGNVQQTSVTVWCRKSTNVPVGCSSGRRFNKQSQSKVGRRQCHGRSGGRHVGTEGQQPQARAVGPAVHNGRHWNKPHARPQHVGGGRWWVRRRTVWVGPHHWWG